MRDLDPVARAVDTQLLGVSFTLDRSVEWEALARAVDSAAAGAVDFIVLRQSDGGIDPSVAAGALIERVSSFFVVEARPGREHPFNTARRLGTIDHLAGGRLGWLAGRRVPADPTDPWSAAPMWPGDPDEVVELHDAVLAVRTLWRTWPRESIAPDRETGVFADSSQIRLANYTGIYSTRGPLPVPTTLQGEPLVWWDWATGDDPNLVADAADIAIVDRPDALAQIEARVPSTLALAAVISGLELAHDELHALSTHSRVSAVIAAVPVGDVDRALTSLDTIVGSRRSTAGAATFRDLFGIPRRSEPNLDDNPSAFEPERVFGMYERTR